MSKDKINNEITLWEEISNRAADTNDEMLSLEDFPRTTFNREPVMFDNEV